MVISDENRYVFVEIPQTASTALAAELRKNYGGRRIFRKHTDYSEFLRTASPGQKRYRVLATVRNPLDIVVSKFVKARDDHGKKYARRDARGAPWGYGFRPEAREHAFISKHGPDFDGFVRKFYPRIYNNRACLLPPNTDVLRYEHLEDDFGSWLGSIGLRVVGPIPRKNTTDRRERDFSDWYSGDLRQHASRVFGPYLRQWGYNLPTGWPAINPTAFDLIYFQTDAILRRFYFRRLHYGWVMPRSTRRALASDDP
jgi:hypothetical protein